MNIADNPFCLSKIFSGQRLHLGICGSIACYKALELLRAFIKIKINVSATLSHGAGEFLKPLLLQGLGADPVYGEMFAETDIFGHLEPGSVARCMLVAPASANSIAKFAHGLADDMLSAQYLAFPGSCVIAPAMNPRMWQSAATQENVAALARRNCSFVAPGYGLMADGETGQGRLAELPEIFLYVLKALSPGDMLGKKVMVTMGPTREPWDAARFWSNPSSGRMGAALATAAWLRGACVTAICGPGVNLYLPSEITRNNVDTARDMLSACEKVWPEMDMGIFTAAVADFSPDQPEGGREAKFKKTRAGEGLTIHFQRNPDILANLASQKKPGQKILGFAAETAADLPGLLPLANKKLQAKKTDIIAANRINGGAFGVDAMPLAVVDCNGREEIWNPQPKADLAWELLSWLLKL